MRNALLHLYVKTQTLRIREEGQDLVEYALLMFLISVALIASMQGIASTINNVFSNIIGSLA